MTSICYLYNLARMITICGETLRNVFYTCDKVTFANLDFNFFACFKAFFPDLSGTSMVGVFILALAVIKISLERKV